MAREIEAVAALDGGPSGNRAGRNELAALIRGLDRTVPGEDPRDHPELRAGLERFPSFAAFAHTRRRALAMLAELALAPGRTVVELGADHCLASSTLLDAGHRVVAIDITDHLKLAPRPEHPGLCRIKADMNRLPIAPGSIDVVWATACVHHSWSLERTFAEARRVLAPDGLFVLLSEPMPAWPRFLLFGLGRRFGAAERELGINETLHRRGRWLAAARGAGFAPKLRFPRLSETELARRLEDVPGILRPLARALAGRGAPLAQVSIHMIAVPDGRAVAPADR